MSKQGSKNNEKAKEAGYNYPRQAAPYPTAPQYPTQGAYGPPPGPPGYQPQGAQGPPPPYTPAGPGQVYPRLQHPTQQHPPAQHGPPVQYVVTGVPVQPAAFDAGARFDRGATPNVPPPPPGCMPNTAQVAQGTGQNAVVGQNPQSFWTGGSDGGYTMW